VDRIHLKGEKMGYTVKHKRRFQLFWRRIRNVAEDGLIVTGTHRYFLKEDKTAVEIPIHMASFKFSKERQIMNEEKSRQDAARKKLSIAKPDKSA